MAVPQQTREIAIPNWRWAVKIVTQTVVDTWFMRMVKLDQRLSVVRPSDQGNSTVYDNCLQKCMANSQGGFGCTNCKIGWVDQNSTQREEHGNIPMGVSSFLLPCMWCTRSLLDDTVDSSPKLQAPWWWSEFTIGACMTSQQTHTGGLGACNLKTGE